MNILRFMKDLDSIDAIAKALSSVQKHEREDSDEVAIVSLIQMYCILFE